MGKTIGAIVAGFILQMGGSYLIHSVILMKSYEATSGLWRTEDAMGHRMLYMLLGQFIFVLGAVLIYQRGVEKKSWIGQGIRFGILLALVSCVQGSLIQYVVTPLPHRIVAHWMLLESALTILLGLLIAGICQPKNSAA